MLAIENDQGKNKGTTVCYCAYEREEKGHSLLKFTQKKIQNLSS